jgi:hypothetical protein
MKYLFTVLAMLLAMTSWSAYADPPEKFKGPHFKCFDIDNGHNPYEKVIIKTQFGEEKVVVGQAKLLCEPVKEKCRKVTEYNPYGDCEYLPQAKNSLKCYTIYDKSVDKHVKLSDQFEKNDQVKVGEPRFLCTSAKKKEVKK